MVTWKDEKVEWGTFSLSGHTTSFDKENKVFISLTDKSYTDSEYLYNICSIDHRNEYPIINWHKKLKIHQYIPEFTKHYAPNLKYSALYVNVRGKRIYIDGLITNKK